jgi:hypothetical protein
MTSRKIITSLLSDLRTYVDDERIIFEEYRQEPTDMEQRQNIPKARIALYEDGENVAEQTGNFRPNNSVQSYGIDISVVRSYSQSDASQGELPLVDIKDKIIEWSKGIDPAELTGEFIYSFGYFSSTRIDRFDRFVHITLRFNAIRDLFKNQT